MTDVIQEHWILRVTGDQLETLKDLLSREVECDTAEARKQSHPADRASYHAVLADMHGLLAAAENAEEDN